MATTFNVFSLGRLPTLDPVEGDQMLDQSAVAAWLGDHGSREDPLFHRVREMSPGDDGFDGGSFGSYDLDSSSSPDSFRIDGGPEQTHDATMLFSATLTYKDGTTAEISAVVFQDADGEAYLAPEISENADQAALTAKAIETISLNEPLYAFGNTGQGYNLFGDRVAAQYVCFSADTLIECVEGERRIGDLRPGDLVRTLDGHLAPILWTGGRRISVAMQVAFPWLRPVRISANALGVGTPRRDLLLSPQHRVLLRSRIVERMIGRVDCLAPAGHLTDAPGIGVSPVIEDVHYRHILLDRHDLVMAEGAPAETLLAGPQALRTLSAEARREIFAILPAMRSPETFAPMARPVLSRRRARQLIRRQVLNEKPLLAG